MIRVLQIIPSLDRAGAEKQFAFLCAGLPRDEFEVHACALTRSGPYAAELSNSDIPLWLIEKKWKADPLAYRRLVRLIRKLKPDVVQTWLFAANAYGRMAALQCRVQAIIGSEQCADPWKRGYQLHIDRWLGRRTSKIVVNGRGVKAFYTSRGVAPSKFVLIENGIESHRPSDVSRSELFESLGLPTDARIVAAVGRLWPQKRIRDAIWTAELLKNVRDDVHFLIIGDGPQRRALERFRDNVQIDDRVHFLGHREDVPRMIEHFDLFWQTSGYEGMPNSIMEAMAAGVPVIATDIPGNNDLVRDGVTGYLAPVGDTAEFARKTNKLLDDRQLAATMGEAARREMIENYPVEKMVNRHATLFRELVG